MHRLAKALGLVLALAACRADAPPTGVQETCVRACAARAAHCGSAACVRGCEFVSDRLVEREGDVVLSCVAKARGCDDPVWADCAVRVGPHEDGGPPPPPPPSDEYE